MLHALPPVRCSPARLPAALAPLASQFNKTAIIELYDTVDLIGISSYASMPPAFKLKDLAGAIWQFDQELKAFGPDLKDVSATRGSHAACTDCMPNNSHADCATTYARSLRAPDCVRMYALARAARPQLIHNKGKVRASLESPECCLLCSVCCTHDMPMKRCCALLLTRTRARRRWC